MYIDSNAELYTSIRLRLDLLESTCSLRTSLVLYSMSCPSIFFRAHSLETYDLVELVLQALSHGWSVWDAIQLGDVDDFACDVVQHNLIGPVRMFHFLSASMGYV